MPYLYGGMELGRRIGPVSGGDAVLQPATDPADCADGDFRRRRKRIIRFTGGRRQFCCRGGSDLFSPANRFQKLGVGVGAGLGAFGATVGLGAGVGAPLGESGSALAAPIGRAAGPVGLAVGGLTAVGLFLDDLLSGGSPGPPWELHASGHSPDGLSIAGTRDLTSQDYPRGLTDCEKSKLKPYIPQEDLDSAIVHDSGWVGIFGLKGFTWGNDIYLNPEDFQNGSTTGGLALLGHELVHVRQYKEGMTIPGYLVVNFISGGYA